MLKVRGTTSYSDAGVAEADVVVEAAFERMSVKKEIFSALDQHTKPVWTHSPPTLPLPQA